MDAWQFSLVAFWIAHSEDNATNLQLVIVVGGAMRRLPFATRACVVAAAALTVGCATLEPNVLYRGAAADPARDRQIAAYASGSGPSRMGDVQVFVDSAPEGIEVLRDTIRVRK